MHFTKPYVQFTLSTVGVGGRNQWADVITLQRLLVAAGVQLKFRPDGRWGDDTAAGLGKFIDNWDNAIGNEFGIPPAIANQQILQPDDDWLFRMAAQAQTLIPMPVIPGIEGFLRLHRWFKNKGLEYEPRADYLGSNSRTFWALTARPNLAVQLQCQAGQINRGPIQINCTTYANMMLSVFKHGSLANPNYDPSVANIGDTSSEHLSKSRYQFQLIMREETGKDGKKQQLNYFATEKQISDATVAGKLYSMEIGSAAKRGVGHHALLYSSIVYQSHGSHPSADDCSLETFMKTTTPCIYLFKQ